MLHARDVIQVCSDNETPFMLPEPMSVGRHDTLTQQQQQRTQDEQPVLESRGEPASTDLTDVISRPVTSSRLSTVKVSDDNRK